MLSRLGFCQSYLRDGKCSKPDCKLVHGKDMATPTSEEVPKSKPTKVREEVKVAAKLPEEEIKGFTATDPGRTARKGEEHRKRLDDEKKAKMRL